MTDPTRPSLDAMEDDPIQGSLPTQVPLFPLPDHVLLPASPAPYRVFEARYRALVQDLMARPEDRRWLAVPRLAAGWRDDYHGNPPFHETATVGRIVRCEPLTGGHFFIVVEGAARVRLVEHRAATPYRVARVQPLPDTPPAPSDVAALRRSLEGISQAVYALAQLLGSGADDLARAAGDREDLDAMLWRVASCVVDDPDERQSFLEQRLLADRASGVLDTLTSLVGMAARHVGCPAAA